MGVVGLAPGEFRELRVGLDFLRSFGNFLGSRLGAQLRIPNGVDAHSVFHLDAIAAEIAIGEGIDGVEAAGVAGLMSIPVEMEQPAESNGALGFGAFDVESHLAAKQNGLLDVEILCGEGSAGGQGAGRLGDVQFGGVADGLRRA